MSNQIFIHKVTGFVPFLKDRLTNLLLQMDGSTTRTIAALVGGTITINIKHQEIIQYNE